MAWENRNRCNCYYYAGRRAKGVVYKEYMGRGIAAALVAATLHQQKEQRKALWKQRRAFSQSLTAIQHRIDIFFRFSRQMERFQRLLYRDARENYFKKLFPEAEELSMPLKLTEPDLLPSASAIDQILTRVKQADPEALPLFRRLIAQKPALWQEMTDLAQYAQEAQLNALAGEDPGLKAAFQTKLQALKQELGQKTANILEQMVIERILISWLQTQHTDLLLAKTPANDSHMTKLLQDRASYSQTRLQRALLLLDQMRKQKPPHKKPGPKKHPLSPMKKRKIR